MGAEAVCCGDLYLPDSRARNEAAAEAAWLVPLEPLWDADSAIRYVWAIDENHYL